MATTLTYGATSLLLPSDLLWPDEFAWEAVKQTKEYTITGALLVESAAKQSGQPVTLTGGDSFAWISRADLLTLRAWASIPGAQFSLEYRGETFDVMFDHEAGAIEAIPVIDFSDPAADDQYVVKLRFIKV